MVKLFQKSFFSLGVKNLLNFIGGDGRNLLKGATGILVLKGFSIVLQFVVMTLLSRALGPDGYGVVANAQAWTMILGLLATVGFDGVLVREVSAAKANNDHGKIKALFRFSNLVLLGSSVVLGSIAAICGWILFSGAKNPYMLPAFYVGLLMFPVVGFTRLREGALKGFGHVFQAQLPELFAHPVILFVLVVVLFFSFELNPVLAVGVDLFAIIGAFGLSCLLFKYYRIGDQGGNPSDFHGERWMAIGLSLMLVTGMQLLNRHLDVIMLGAISGSRAAGIYRVANRCSQLMLIFFAAANQVLAPFISRLFVKNKFCKLQKIISLSALGVFCVSVVIWMFFLFFGLPLLGIFGSEFTNGYFALITLSTSFLVCTVASAAGLLLMMTDFEKEAAWSVIASAVVNVFLNALLIPAYSYNGAAIATAVSTLVMNLLMVIFTIKRLKINPTFFGLLRFRRGNDER